MEFLLDKIRATKNNNECFDSRFDASGMSGCARVAERA